MPRRWSAIILLLSTAAIAATVYWSGHQQHSRTARFALAPGTARAFPADFWPAERPGAAGSAWWGHAMTVRIHCRSENGPVDVYVIGIDPQVGADALNDRGRAALAGDLRPEQYLACERAVTRADFTFEKPAGTAYQVLAVNRAGQACTVELMMEGKWWRLPD